MNTLTNLNSPSATTLALGASSTINPEVAKFEKYFDRILPTGSRIICNPPVTDTDEDYLILVRKENLAALQNQLVEEEYYCSPGSGGGSYRWDTKLSEVHTYNEDGTLDMTNVFQSFKRQEFQGVLNEDYDEDNDNGEEYLQEPSGPILNILVTCNKDYFEDFTRATYLAKELNLTSKADRVLLFEALTRDKWPDGKTEEPKKKPKSFWDRTLGGSTYAYQILANQVLSSPPGTAVIND